MVRFLWVFLVAGRVFALETPTVTQERARQMAPVTPAECRLPGENGDPVQMRRHRVQTRDAAPKSGASTATPIPNVVAPPATLGFHAAHSVDILPADAAGAVGPGHVVGAFNAGLYIHNREGTLLASYPTFWSEGFESFSFDPRIVRDDAANRWVTVAVNDDGFENDSGVVVTVSSTGDPTGTWARYKIDAPSRGAADFIQLAQTNDSIVFSFNVFDGDFDEGSNIIVIDKATLYARPATLPITRYDFGTTQYAVPVTVRDSADNAIRVLFPDGAAVFISRLVNGQFVGAGTLSPPGAESSARMEAPQLGSSQRIILDPWELMNGIVRNDVLWVVRTVARTNLVSAIELNRIAGTTSERILLYDPNGQVYLAHPSIAVNRDGAAIVGFSQFSSTQYASAGYVYRDPAGTWSDRVTLKSGEKPYAMEVWGDYSTTLVDPVNDTDFWTVQSYAYPIDAIQATWGTWWGKITAAKAPGRGRPVRRF